MSNETKNDELIVKGIEVKNDIIEELDVVFEADEDMELRLNEEEETRSEEKQEEQLEIRDAVFPLEFKRDESDSRTINMSISSESPLNSLRASFVATCESTYALIDCCDAR